MFKKIVFASLIVLCQSPVFAEDYYVYFESESVRETDYKKCLPIVESIHDISMAILDNFDAYDKAPHIFDNARQDIEDLKKNLQKCEEKEYKKKTKKFGGKVPIWKSK